MRKKLFVLFSLLTVFLFTGCIKVSSFDPANGATGVDRDASVKITFSANPKADTINNSTVFLKNVSETVIPCDLSISGKVVTLKPKARLAMKANYSVHVTKGVYGSLGALDKEYSIDFQTKDATWNAPTELSSLPLNNVMAIDCAIDSNGHAIVVWSQKPDTGTERGLYMSEYRDGVWTTDQIAYSTFGIYYPKVVMNDSGWAAIIWQHHGSSTSQRIFKRERTNYSTSWSNIEISTTNSSTLDAAMKGDKAIAVWTQLQDGKYVVYKSEGEPGKTWVRSAASSTLHNCEHPRVDMNDSGKYVIAWNAVNSAGHMGVYIGIDNGVYTANQCMPLLDESCYKPEIAIDNDGNYGFLYTHSYEGEELSLLSYFGGTLRMTDLTSSSNGLAESYSIDCNNSGKAIAAYSYETTPDSWDYNAVFSVFTNGVLSSTTSVSGSGIGKDMRVKMNSARDAIVSWTQDYYNARLAMNRNFGSGGLWSVSTLNTGSERAFYGESDLASNGEAIHAWVEGDTQNYRVYVSLFK